VADAFWMWEATRTKRRTKTYIGLTDLGRVVVISGSFWRVILRSECRAPILLDGATPESSVLGSARNSDGCSGEKVTLDRLPVDSTLETSAKPQKDLYVFWDQRIEAVCGLILLLCSICF
jgi:hypothetical protein